MKFPELFEEEFIELTISIPSKYLKTKKFNLLEEGRWIKSSNNLDYLIHKRPDICGGYQIHIRDRNGRLWAYRQDGNRSEPHKYKLKASREVKELVRTIFQLPDDLLIEDYLNIEAYLLKADGSKRKKIRLSPYFLHG